MTGILVLRLMAALTMQSMHSFGVVCNAARYNRHAHAELRRTHTSMDVRKLRAPRARIRKVRP